MAVGNNINSFKQEDSKEIALQIASLIKDIRFGSLEVVIHDGRVVQIDKRERFRIGEQNKPA